MLSPISLSQQYRNGFTLVELVVVILILGVLAASAISKFGDIRSEARTAKVKALAGAIESAATLIRMKCAVTPTCNMSSNISSVTVDGIAFTTNYGWPDAGNSIGVNLIDMAVNYSGFTVSIADPSTIFRDMSAIDPNNCYVEYRDAWQPAHNQRYVLVIGTSGC